MNARTVSKALAGGASAASAALITAASDGHVTLVEWVIVALSLIGGTGAVYAAPRNDPTAARD